nr:MAK10-like protein [Tanacetum cinerariifolium]
MEPEDSLIIRDEDLHTIPKKESDEFIKSSVEDLVPIPRESEDMLDSNKECDLTFCNNFVTFSNPLFDVNDDFTSSNDESLPEEGISKENVKIYSNLLFKFDDKYISSDVNLLFNEIDTFLDIDISTNIEDGYHDLEGDIIYLESLLINDTIPNLHPEITLVFAILSLNSIVEILYGESKVHIEVLSVLWRNRLPIRTVCGRCLEDLTLYDKESWNDPRDFAKPVKAIALPQDVLNTSDRRLIELEKQVQRLMEAHLAPTQPTQVNKITTSYEICSVPHDTQYCIEDPEQAFVEYASSRTDKARGALPCDTVKNLKLSTFPVLSARSYPKIGPQCLCHPSTSINAIKAHSKEATISQTSLLRPGMEIKMQQSEEPEPTLEDEFKDLHLNLPDPKTPLLVGRGFIATANAVIDCRMIEIALGEGITRDSSLSIGIFVRDKMSRDVITVGSTMRIPLLYRGEYSQWHERFMNYLEEQTDGEAMINSIQNEKNTRKIDRLARSLLIQRLPNDIYSLIDSNETVKDLWDALERQMRGSEYGEQDRKAEILYEYETFKAIEGEQLLDTYLRYLQKFYSKPTNNNLRTSSTSQSANKKQEFVKSDDKKVDKKVDEKKRDLSKVKCYNCKKEGHFAKDCKKAKVKDYNYYKTKMLLAKKDSNKQVLLAEDQAWMESSSDSDQEKSMQTWSSWHKLKRFFQNQTKVLHLLKKPLLR